MSDDNSEQLAPKIEQYRDKIVRFLVKKVPSSDVEDLAQETLLTVHACLKKGKTLYKPLAFLYKTANFVVGKYRRSQKTVAMTDTVADVDALGLESDVPSLERNVGSELEYEAVCVVIERLPNKCRNAFVLRKVYQYSYKEIAEHCGVSVNTVKNHVKKGFKIVQRYRDERRAFESS